MFQPKEKETISNDFWNRNQSKIIYRAEIRAHILKQIERGTIADSKKKTIQKVLRHFVLLEKDSRKIQRIIQYFLHKKKTNYTKKCIRKNVKKNFVNLDNPPRNISRGTIGVFLYENLFINSDFSDIVRKNINSIMEEFNLGEEDGFKVIKIVSFLLEHDNYILAPKNTFDDTGDTDN